MRTTRTGSIGYVSCVLVACALCGCGKKLTAEAIEASPGAIVQQGKTGSSAWVVTPDGKVSAALKDPDGKPVTQPVTGQMTFATPSGPPVSVPIQGDPQSGVITAEGPKLEADITPVTYALTVNGKPWNGSLDVPRGGTQDLVASAKLQAAEPAAPAVGPNGGVVQVVGPDKVEVVANKSTGDVRAYVLGPDGQPVDPGDRTITVALQGEAPEVVVLAPEPQGHFVFGHLRARMDPVHVTVAVNAHGTTHASLIGWAPGAVLLTGPEAPRVHLLAVDAWPGEVVVGHGRHHGEVVVGAPGVAIEGSAGFVAPGVVVGGPGIAVGGPGIVGPGVVVGGPTVVVGGPHVVGGPGPGREHVVVHEHEHGGHRGH